MCEINRSRSHVIDYTYEMNGFLFRSEFLDRINEIKERNKYTFSTHGDI